MYHTSLHIILVHCYSGCLAGRAYPKGDIPKNYVKAVKTAVRHTRSPLMYHITGVCRYIRFYWLRKMNMTHQVSTMRPSKNPAHILSLQPSGLNIYYIHIREIPSYHFITQIVPAIRSYTLYFILIQESFSMCYLWYVHS